MTINGTETAAWRVHAAEEYRTKKADKVREVAGLKRRIERLHERVVAVTKEIADLDAGARAFGLSLDDLPPVTDGGDLPPADGASSDLGRSGPMFKDLALEMLEKAYPRPLRAAQIKERAEKQLGRTFHPKTPGMSLYRLAQESKVLRRGWDWFFVPEAERGALALARSNILPDFDFSDPDPEEEENEPGF